MIDIKLFIHEFITLDTENFTLEFRLIPAQLERAYLLSKNWQYTKYEIAYNEDMNKPLSHESVLYLIHTRRNFPRYDKQGNQIIYEIRKIKEDTSIDYQSKKHWTSIELLGITYQFNYSKRFVDQVKQNDELVIFPGLRAGGPDVWTIAGSIAAVAQVILVVADMWIRRRDRQKIDATSPISPVTIPVNEIRVLMQDGTWIFFKQQTHQYDKLYELIESFRKRSSSNKPNRVIFVFDDGTTTELKISTRTDRKNLKKFMELLKK